MAHSEAAKGRALALLMTGNTVNYVAKETGIPRTTIRRWKYEGDDLLVTLARSMPPLQRWDIPGFNFHKKPARMDPKKRDERGESE